MTVPSRRASVHEFRSGILAETQEDSRGLLSSSRASISNSPVSYKIHDTPPRIIRRTSRYLASTLRPNGAGERKRGFVPTASYPHVQNCFSSLPVAGPLASVKFPHSLSYVFEPQETDFDHDRLARACGQDALSASASSPALWSGSDDHIGYFSPKTRHSSLTLKQAQGIRSPRLLSRTSSRTRPSSPPPAPPFPHPHRKAVLESLESDLQGEGRTMEEFFSKNGRDHCLSSCRKTFVEWSHGHWGCRPPHYEPFSRYNDPDHRIFHVPLEMLHSNAMTTATVVGYRHELPLVVVACVEELYRTGIYQRDLFRALPDRLRLSRLVQGFNNLPKQLTSSRLPSLAHETTPNICSLLGEYIAALPSSLIPRDIFDALWSWSVSPSLAKETELCRNLMLHSQDLDASKRESIGNAGGNGDVQGSHAQYLNKSKRSVLREACGTLDPLHFAPQRNSPLYTPKARVRANQLERELYDFQTPHISIVSHLLLLLPPRSFSLILYLFSFFSQLPLSPENGLTFEDVGRIFAFQLLGGPNRSAARIVMVWLLDHWSRILEGFENIEEQSQQPVQEDIRVPAPSPSSPSKDGLKVRFFDELPHSERISALRRQEIRPDGHLRSYSVDEIKLASKHSECFHGRDSEDLRKQLEMLIRERDDAVRVFQEIRRVVIERQT